MVISRGDVKMLKLDKIEDIDRLPLVVRCDALKLESGESIPLFWAGVTRSKFEIWALESCGVDVIQ